MAHTLTNIAHHDSESNDIFGFWLYILSDCILFATLFSTFAVLHNSVFGGPSIKDLTNIHSIFIETMVLLISSFTYGLAILNLYKNESKKVMTWLSITFLFGLTFVFLELSEFIHLTLDGNNWQTSAALSAFFTLVGTHGLHVIIGLIWMLVMLLQLSVFGITPVMSKRLTYLGLFWTFLDIIWIFVFTVVYLMGAI